MIMPSNITSVEVRVKGNWITIPAVDVGGKNLIALGKRLRIASVRGEEMMLEELQHPETYISMLKGEAKPVLKADIFTFTQKPPSNTPRFSYLTEWDSVAAIHLNSFEEWWQNVPQETRKNVRRAQRRGVEVSIREFDDALIDGIREVNDDSPMRQGTRNGYYGKSAKETRKLYGEFVGRCDFICAHYDGRLIGFLHLVYRRDVASILNLTTAPSHFDKRPANALIAKAVEICAEKRISHIVYGLYNYGNKHDHPLRTFKIRNGFQELLMPRYFVPLTAWGKLCMKANLHRGAVGILPHRLITFLVDARAHWYKWTAFTSRRSSIVEQSICNRQMERSNPPAGSNT